MIDYRLTGQEERELLEQLSPEEWEAFLRAQRLLVESPMAEPDAGFADRVVTRLIAQERARERRHFLLQALVLGPGSLIVAVLLIWSSPFGVLFQVSGWTALLDGADWLFGVAATAFVVTSTFIATLLATIGAPGLLLFGVLAMALILAWSRVVGPASLNHSASV